MENRLKEAYFKLNNLIKSQQFINSKPNLSKTKQQTMKNLKSHPFTYLPSDKGGEFCVVTTEVYDSAAFEHLNDTTVYSKVKHITPKTIEDKLNRMWKSIAADINLSDNIIRRYVTNNSRMPQFYHLIKTHKKSPEIKIRPIVSNSNGPTYKISWLLNRLLKHLLKTVPAHLENSKQLLQAIKSMPKDDLKRHPYPFSLDVCALYTSIPTNEAIDNIGNILHSDTNSCKPFKPHHIIDLLTVIFSNTYFEYKNKFYKQKAGLPMGSNLSGLLAILFMDTIEKSTLSTFHVSIYRRYVDDIFMLAINYNEAERIFHFLNTVHPNIQFEIEHPDGNNSLALLDFRITINDGVPTFEFYQKSAKKNMFIHANSAVPTSTKISIATNELNRRIERCSTTELKQKHKQSFRNLLVSSSYKDKQINRIFQSKKKKSNDAIGPTAYFHVPYISDNINHKIRNIFKSTHLPVRVYSKSFSLRNALKTNSKKECAWKSCILKNDKICLKTNVVYHIKCNKCSNSYIGSTIKEFHIRYKQHFNDDKSAIFKHNQICNNNSYSCKIIASDNDFVNLRIKESMKIHEIKPTLNSQMDYDDLKSITYFN